MKTSLCILFLLSLTKVFCQDTIPTPNFYWEYGVKKFSKDMQSNVFYLSLINESLNDSIKNKENDKEILRLLKPYKFTIEHKGIADDEIGYVFYRKLIFQNKLMDHITIQEIYQKLYSYEKIHFFGPQIYDVETHYGAGLQRMLDIIFNAKTTKDEIEKLIKKYKLTIIGEYPFAQSISVRFTNTYGLEIINVTTKIQEDSCVAKTLNHLYIQNVH